ncbi:hypothetical protein EV681_0585 [Advenella incenata]|uniref:Uncharacterized protein n=1 Tax=Advenella incenata TaxID=267800 RepID=A0A4Q7VRE9_9BURK|nr:hypothetical protein EV681_0585 [Advenella incenata]
MFERSNRNTGVIGSVHKVFLMAKLALDLTWTRCASQCKEIEYLNCRI